MGLDLVSKTEEEVDVHNSKKTRLFSAKDFRSSLQREDKSNALHQFSQLCSSSKKHDYMFEYFEAGGSCLEVLQTLAGESTVKHTVVLEIVTHLLLEIGAKYPQLERNAYETCRHFLSNYMTLINKMLSLRSSVEERKVILKLLTVIVTFSPRLAKDILMHVKFDQSNLEMLTKHTGEENGVRNGFVHFITSLFVGGYYPTISVVLEKQILLTCIIKGLCYDAADTVCVVLTSLKNHVLENHLIWKTIKMKIFSTPVIKDIVNLYNWKGPHGYDPRLKRKHVTVNEYDKSKVNESVHDFLLVLCTSHKFGVIFRDPQVGLGTKTQNNLMHTVLEGLERPWEHSYAGELIIKICGVCPDLVKTMWKNLKPFLEPRPTTKWLKALKFTKDLLRELRPSCIEFCVKDLSETQLTKVTQMLIAPTQILKMVLPPNGVFEIPVIKHHVLQLLIDILKSVESYITAATTWLTCNKLQTYKNNLVEHVVRNFPNALSVITRWKNETEEVYEGFEVYDVPDYLKVCFDLLELYQIRYGHLLDGLNTEITLQEMLQHMDVGEQFNDLRIKIIRLFLSVDRNMFLPNGNTFASVLHFILEHYYDKKDAFTYGTLYTLLDNTGIFEGNETEINVWINSIFDLNIFDDGISELLVGAVTLTCKKMVDYLTELSQIKELLNKPVTNFNIVSVLDNLVIDNQKYSVRHTNLSALVLGIIEYSSEKETSESVKCYLSYCFLNLLHSQTSPDVLIQICRNMRGDICSKKVLKYLLSSNDGDVLSVSPKTKGKLNLLPRLTRAFVSHQITAAILQELTADPTQSTFLFHTGLFYLANLARSNKLTLADTETFVTFIKSVSDVNTTYILHHITSHPVLLQYFSPLNLHENTTSSFCTHFIKEIICHFKSTVSVEVHLTDFRAKLYHSLVKFVKRVPQLKTSSLGDAVEILEVFSLDFEQCYTLVNNITSIDFTICETDISKLLVFCLQQLCDLAVSTVQTRPLEPDVIRTVSRMFADLNRGSDTSKFASCVSRYLILFPHCFEFIVDDLVESVCTKAVYCKENADLVVLILRKRSELLSLLMKNLENISTKKGLILPLIEVVVEKKVAVEILRKMYDTFEPSILKALQKPHKAGQHFEKHYKAVGVLIKQFFPLDNCKHYVDKVQKFEVTAVFHSYFMEVIFDKAIFETENYNEKALNTCLLTFIHLCTNLLKKKERNIDEWNVLNDVASIFDRFLQKICLNETTKSVSYVQVCKSDIFEIFCKFCLKFGMSGNESLLKVLKSLLRFLNLQDEDATLLMDMIVSHSEFLEIVLNESNTCKMELLSVISELCRRWPGIMQKNHVPILLASYGATLRSSDRIVLSLLKRYEALPAQTFFYEFKPFLWGASAANHYSVRSDIQKALWRQPKMRDVLQILKEHHVLNTIKHCCLNLSLDDESVEVTADKYIYDITFLLPLFSSLLAPENAVQTYHFTKSGALSLTVLALSSENKDVRAAACHVLFRFYHHLEANHFRKDDTLWSRFVEAVCRGTCVFEDVKLNNFASIFLARMALILTRPTHVMYVPLTQYLGAKSTLDFRSVPELYTFIHSPDVNFKQHRIFILEILRDGIRTDNDFDIALRSNSFKIIMELFSSSLSDVDAQSLILEVLRSAARISSGVKLLCSSYGLVSWLHQVVLELDTSQYCHLPIILDILHYIATLKYGKSSILTLSFIIDKISVYNLAGDALMQLLKTTILIFEQETEFVTESRLRRIISFVGSKECEYLLKFGSNYVDFDFNLNNGDELYYSKYLTLKWILSNK